MPDRYLAIDLGAESGRAVVGTLVDGVLSIQEIRRFETGCMPLGRHLVVDVYRIYEEILVAMRSCAARFGGEIVSVGVDAWGSDFCLADGNGNLIGLPVFYRDGRTEGTCEIVEAKIGYRKLHELTNHRKTSTGTLHQLIAMASQERTSLSNGESMLFIADIFNFFLSGRLCSEYTAASYSQLFCTTRGQWEDSVFDLFGISRSIQPQLVRAGEALGTLRPELAQATGLGVSTLVVAPAAHDTADAVAATPAEGTDWAFISSGTWSLLGVETDGPVVNDLSYQGNFSNSGLAFGKILFKISIAGLWIIQQCRRVWISKGSDLSYAEIGQLAARAESFKAFIDPESPDFFCPDDMPLAISRFIERSGGSAIAPGDKGQIARIVYESLAMRYRQGIELTEAATGRAIRRIHIIGGGSRNELLNSFTASATGLPVVAGPAEATAIGNLLIQAYGCGEIRSGSDVREIVRKSFPSKTFETSDAALWREQFGRYLETCASC
jgi:rhamnulokinase